MAFTVDLYSINVRSDAANKLSGAVRQQSITTDLPRVITSNGCTVQYDQFINCNYARYEFNGLTWVCDVEIETVGNSIVNYILTVDPLSTAYYNGCFNSTQYITRNNSASNYAASHCVDPLLPKDASQTITRITQQILHGEYRYLINVLDPSPGTGSYYYLPSNVSVYSVNYSGLNAFLSDFINMSDVKQQQFAPCILGIKAVPVEFLSTSAYPSYQVDGITLRYIQSSVNTTPEETTITIGSRTDTYQLRGSGDNFNRGINFYFKPSIATFSFMPNELDSVIHIHIPTVGRIECRASSLGTYDVTQIGFRYELNPISGAQRATLICNNVLIEDVYCEEVLKNAMPMMIDTSVVEWNSIISQGFNSVALSTLGGFITGGYGGAALGLVTSGISALASGVSSMISAGNGTSSVNGISGGDIDTFSANNMNMLIRKSITFHEDDVHSKYGYLKLAYDNLNSYTGYIQTSNCALPHNGLPRSVIDSANSLLDAGVWVL